MNRTAIIYTVATIGLITTLLVGSAFFGISLGKFEMAPSSIITVTGTAESQHKNQVASFSAGVTAVNDNKDNAVSEVNDKVTAIIEAVKVFGIPAQDIKTQNLNIYQSEETYYEEGRQKSKLGQWRVNNTIEIKLRNVDAASALADVLTQSGANNVYGPNFTMDDTTGFETELIDAAIKNAQEKAGKVAASSGRRLGKIVNVSEGISSRSIYPVYRDGMGGGGGPAEPGSGTVSKSVTVTFELR